jgi:hypothetical protein
MVRRYVSAKEAAKGSEALFCHQRKLSDNATITVDRRCLVLGNLSARVLIRSEEPVE